MSVLTLVATPIGNLGDLSPRAVEALAAADVVACEDTRRTGRLLQHAGVDGVRLMRLDAHTEDRAAQRVVACLDEGQQVAVVTDAGTPGISDPGERLVNIALAAGHQVTVVPGPAAPVAALVISGLPTQRWCMEGFLPRKGQERKQRLAEIAVEERTTVLFESPKRVGATVADLLELCGPDRPMAIVREVTKLHEEVFRGSLQEASDWASKEIKGEVVLVLGGAPPPAEADDQRLGQVLEEILASGVSTRDAADEAARRLGVSRRRAYSSALDLRGDR
ncbi:MAG: 16S rRNA (cytidine(1402)-2'-O)-methyltransferase [Actinobacteria bacterium]|nr:16S rRNA (cytidine(1402)-2'-O)-methyltransferase [Actinomycetota bacterium]MBT3745650.1 16S rRNA (cytidine(1402)-2'-O)-methyltransferase [Actinomycetota bacterium]MBT4476136.1 16S rRNA (cytidine(1402)-2'-O)-methyltransferase [Actinomycetota bacterium]MBT4656304.1 16S rRNA (cytidine(1402)-2'-O)-methyltransferase [Actinomycetota bacterium]MBT5084093.1 16S rRNA (cytidine(1402)-2'-O)-methyltransferase [Actinomycetota bacterium]